MNKTKKTVEDPLLPVNFPNDPDIQRVVTAFAAHPVGEKATIAKLLSHFVAGRETTVRQMSSPWARVSHFEEKTKEVAAIQALLARLSPQRFMKLPEPPPDILPQFEAYVHERGSMSYRERYQREVALVGLYKGAVNTSGLNLSHDAVMARCTGLPTPDFNYLHTIGSGGGMSLLIDRMDLSPDAREALKVRTKDRLFELLDAGIPLCTVNKIQNHARCDVLQGVATLQEAIEQRVTEFLSQGNKGGWGQRKDTTKEVVLPTSLMKVIDDHVNGCTVGMDEADRERERTLAHDGIKSVLSPVYEHGLPVRLDGEAGDLHDSERVFARVRAWVSACFVKFNKAAQEQHTEIVLAGFKQQWGQVYERGRKDRAARKKRLAPQMKEIRERYGVQTDEEARRAVLKVLRTHHPDRGHLGQVDAQKFKVAEKDCQIINSYRC
jgi:hypothetical protein